MPRKAIQRVAAARSTTTAPTLSEIRPISISVSEPYLSTPRTETTFRARKTASPDEASPLRGDDHKVNILLVDDTPDKLTAHEAVLVDLEQNIVKARSGREALRCLLQQEFAVILLDINMPGMDGFETAELIRQRKATAHTPIIFLTSFSTGDTDVYRGYSSARSIICSLRSCPRCCARKWACSSTSPARAASSSANRRRCAGPSKKSWSAA